MKAATNRSRRTSTADADLMPRGMRRLVVAGSTWHWRYGDPIIVRAPDGTRTRIPLATLTGMCIASIERAAEKRNLSVRPSDVAAWIARNILGYTDRGGYPASAHAMPLAAPQPGTLSVLGPRGRWRWRAGPWTTTIVSPEGVACDVRTYELLGMTLEEWTTTKSELIRRTKEPVRALLRQTDTLRLLDCDVPGMPTPGEAEVSKWIADFAGIAQD